jgi:MFS transporter, FSR family, fosmidomycin resistance protein
MKTLKKVFPINRPVALLSAGHFINDAYPGYLAPLLPLLMQKIGFSLTLAGTLVSIQAVASSLMQPLFGMLSDRLRRPWLVICGPLLTALFFSAIGLVSSWSHLALLIIFGGLGTAAFHPQAASLTGQYGGERKGLSMSTFVTAGSAGHSLGPLIILSVVTGLGLAYSWITVIWGAIISLLLWRFLPNFVPVRTQQTAKQHNYRLGGRKSLLVLIWLVVFFRAFVIDGFLAFNPLYLHQHHFSVMLAGSANTIFELSGSAGTLLGGHFSDRLGHKKIIVLSFLGSAPLLWLFLHTQGVIALLFLGLAGFFLYCSVPVTILMAQELFPNRSGAVSSLTMGFAWGMAGLLLTPFGAVSDKIGLGAAFHGLLYILPASLLVAACLPGKNENKNQ